MARKLNVNFGAVPYTLQSSTGRIWAGGVPQTLVGAGGIGSFIPNAALGVTWSGQFVNGQTVTVNLPGGGLGAKASPLPLYYWPFELNLATHATLSRTSKTLTGSNANTFIQTSVKPANSAGSCQAIPVTGGTQSTAFAENPVATLVGGAGTRMYVYAKTYRGFSALPNNDKFFRIWQGSSGAGNYPDAYFNWQNGINEFDGETEAQTSGANLTTGLNPPANNHFIPWDNSKWINNWRTCEWFWQENTFDVIDGIHNCAYQGQFAYHIGGRWQQCGTNQGPNGLRSFYPDQFTGGGNGVPNGTTDIMYHGILLVDDSFLQLVITDEGSSYNWTDVGAGAADHNREIQIQTLRSDTSITFVIRKGEFASLAGKNLLALTGYGTSINLGVCA